MTTADELTDLPDRSACRLVVRAWVRVDSTTTRMNTDGQRVNALGHNDTIFIDLTSKQLMRSVCFSGRIRVYPRHEHGVMHDLG